MSKIIPLPLEAHRLLITDNALIKPGLWFWAFGFDGTKINPFSEPVKYEVAELERHHFVAYTLKPDRVFNERSAFYYADWVQKQPLSNWYIAASEEDAWTVFNLMRFLCHQI